MHGIVQDAKFFLRQTRRRPIWSLSIVGVLSLGISANTAMYAGFDAWVRRPLPFADPAELVVVNESQPKIGVTHRAVSPATFQNLAREVRAFEQIEAWDSRYFNVSDSAEPARLLGTSVTHGLFSMLGIQPVVGRAFVPEDDVPGQPAPVALIGHRLWVERYQSDPGIVGRRIRLNGQPHDIIGVMPEGFRFPSWSDLWTPLGLDPENVSRGRRYLDVAARLADGVTAHEAREEAGVLAETLAERFPETNEGFGFVVRPLRYLWVPRVIEIALATSMAAAFFLLLIVCANVASLMLAQASSRSREAALRTALGASRWRLARQTIVESTVLALGGGLFGILLAEWWLHGMYDAAPIEPPYIFSMEINFRIALYTLLVSLLAGVVSALGPLTRSTGRNVHDELRSASRLGSSAWSSKLRAALVLGELTLSAALAIGALLMVKSFVRQHAVDPGYKIEGITTMELSLTDPELAEPGARIQFLERLHDELMSSGAIDSVGSVNALPSGPVAYERSLEAEGRPLDASERVRALMTSYMGSYLTTLEIPLLEGRRFTAAELRDGGDVALVSESLARRLWPESDAVGKRVRELDGGAGPWLTVVGVVGNVERGHDMVPHDLPAHQFYRPYASAPTPMVTLSAASPNAAAEVADVVRNAVRAAGSAVPISEVLSMRQAIFRVQWVTGLFSEQIGLYGLIALVIAAVGLYGLVADAVSRRSHEIAVRLAIGARREDVVRAIVVKALHLAALGTAMGVVLGVAGASVSSTMLVGVSPFDPFVWAIVVAILIVTSFLASYLPARRAASMNPMRALQSE